MPVDETPTIQELLGEAESCVARAKAGLANIAYVRALSAGGVNPPPEAVKLVVTIDGRHLRLPSGVLGDPGIAPLYPAIAEAEEDEVVRQVASLHAVTAHLYALFVASVDDQAPPGPAITSEALNAARQQEQTKGPAEGRDHQDQAEAAHGGFYGPPRAG